MNLKKVSLWLLPVSFLACNDNLTQNQQPFDHPYDDLTVSLEKPAFGYQIKSQPHLVAPGEESYRCDVVRIDPTDGDTLIFLDRVESHASKNTHHMNVYVGLFSVVDAVLGEGTGEVYLGHKVGSYDCNELGDLMELAIPIYPSQREEQIVELPAGVAMPSLAPLVLVMEHHYINLSEKDVMINAALNMHRIPENEVEQILSSFYGAPLDLDIPANTQKTEARTCVVDRDINIIALSTHSHEKGECFTINEFEGPTSTIAPSPLYVNKEWQQPPVLQYAANEWQLKAGEGLHYACHYYNDEDRSLYFGPSASDEMCIFVAIGYPSRITVQDLKNALADPLNVDFEQLERDAFAECAAVETASPWPFTTAVEQDWVDTCADYPQTINSADVGKAPLAPHSHKRTHKHDSQH